MLNFAEQTGSGAVTVIWSFPPKGGKLNYINPSLPLIRLHREIHKIKGNAAKGGEMGKRERYTKSHKFEGKGKEERGNPGETQGKPRGNLGET